MIQISITTDRTDLEEVERTLLDHGAQSVTLRDAADDPVLEPPPGETPLWPRLVVTGLFSTGTEIEPVRQTLKASASGELEFEVEALAERDWMRAWSGNLAPLRFANRLRILPTGHDEPDCTAVDIRLDPGLAFGTGAHPTTHLCLEWLDAKPPLGAGVIDYGCGSGILAIASIRLGARRAWAVDLDPQALLATRDNADRNHITPQQLIVSHPQDLRCERAELLLANILARPLVELAPSFARRVESGGRLVLSGLLPEQIAEVSAAYAPWFEFGRLRDREGWVLLEGTKR